MTDLVLSNPIPFAMMVIVVLWALGEAIRGQRERAAAIVRRRPARRRNARR